jgi:hypothetical protein
MGKDKTNAKEELLGILERTKSSIKCAYIKRDMGWWDDSDVYISPPPISLKEGYTTEEYAEFLTKLDFGYDSGYGGQELLGTIWLMKENTWLERGEYDGSEWWEYNECPQIPDELKAD